MTFLLQNNICCFVSTNVSVVKVLVMLLTSKYHSTTPHYSQPIFLFWAKNNILSVKKISSWLGSYYNCKHKIINTRETPVCTKFYDVSSLNLFQNPFKYIRNITWVAVQYRSVSAISIRAISHGYGCDIAFIQQSDECVNK